MSSPRRLLGLAILAALYWIGVGTLLIVLAAYGVEAINLGGYCSGPGNQLGLPSCERVGQGVLLVGFFVALALYSRTLWKVARRG
jgi:hypothetical protein